MGRGPKGTELYVKIEKGNIEEQFPRGSGGEWKGLTLWFGDKKLNGDHRLSVVSGKYYLVVCGGNGEKCDLPDGRGVNHRQVEAELRKGGFDYVRLDEEKWTQRSGRTWTDFWGDSCRYQWVNKDEVIDWNMKFQCK